MSDRPMIKSGKFDTGVLQIFMQSTDDNKVYSTSLNGTYDLILTDIKLIVNEVLGESYACQIVSDSFRLDKGTALSGSAYQNDFIKFFKSASGCPELPSPLLLKSQEIRNWVSVSLLRLGTIEDDINQAVGGYNLLLTFEYKRL